MFLHSDSSAQSAALVAAPELMAGGAFQTQQHGDATTYVIGPGLGRDEEAESIFATLLNLSQASGVIDADGLHFLTRQPQPVPGWVLTPHEGEAAQLLGISSSEVRADRSHTALALAEKFQTVVVLKGAGTLIAFDRRLLFCHPGNAAMSTPGMGDCLAGILGSLLAQGMSATEAALAAVNWHAAIGARLAQSQRLVLASDIIEQLKQQPGCP